MINFLHKERESMGKEKQRAGVAFGACVVHVVVTIVTLPCFIFGTDIFGAAMWKPNSLLKCLNLRGRYLFLLESDPRCPPPVTVEEPTTAEILMGCTYAGMCILRKLIGLYENLVTSVGGIVLWISTNEFVSSLVTKNGWGVISRRYNHLRSLTDLINEVFGPFILAHFLIACFFYSSHLEKVFGTGDLFDRLTLWGYYIVFILTVLVASDVCRQVS